MWFGRAAWGAGESKRRRHRIHSPERTGASDFEGHEVWGVDIDDWFSRVRQQFSLVLVWGLSVAWRRIGQNLVLAPATAEGFDELDGCDQALAGELRIGP